MTRFYLFVMSIIVFLSLWSFEARAYEPEVHFYLTTLIGRWCGLTSEGDRVALANYSLDAFRATNAGMYPSQWLDIRKITTRRVFHFPVPRGTNLQVVRNSQWAWATVNLAVSESSSIQPNLEMLGIGMHTLQDSFSHEGFTPKYGHWTTAPDYPENDPDRFVEAAEATHQAFDQWLKKMGRYGCARPFPLLEPVLYGWAKTELTGDATLYSIWKSAVEDLLKEKIEIGNVNDSDFRKVYFEAVGKVWSFLN